MFEKLKRKIYIYFLDKQIELNESVLKIREKQNSPYLRSLITKSFLIGGKDKTINHLFEEMGELITAICQNNRGRNSVNDIKSEMADVLILLAKCELIYGKCDKQIHFKLKRLEERMKNV